MSGHSEEQNIKINHQGIEIIFDESVIKFCKNPGFIRKIFSLFIKQNIMAGRSSSDRIKNTITFFKTVIDYSFAKLKNRGLNLQKIKKTFKRIEVKMRDDKNQNEAASYNRSTKNICLYITFEGKYSYKNPGSTEDFSLGYEETINEYSYSLIHEIGHAIDNNFLSKDAKNYWKEGWSNISKSFYASKMHSANNKDNKEIIEELKQESINEILKKYSDHLQSFKNSQSSSLQNLNLFEIYEKSTSTFEKGHIIKILFENKNLNIFKEDLILRGIHKSSFASKEDKTSIKIFDLSETGKLCLICLLSPSSLLNFTNFLSFHISEKKIKYFKEKTGIEDNFSAQQIQNILIKNVFISPFNASYNPFERADLENTSYFENEDFENNKAVNYLQTPTSYSHFSYSEDWAETFAFYVLKPSELSEIALNRIKKTLALSSFYNQKLEEKLLRKLIRIILS